MGALLAIQLLAFAAIVSGAQSQGEGHGLSIIDSAAGVPDKTGDPGCPVSCLRADPVCGTNGATYWCGARDAACDGVEVAHAGYCSPGNGGSLGKGAMAGRALLLVHVVWLILAGVLVLFGIA